MNQTPGETRNETKIKRFHLITIAVLDQEVKSVLVASVGELAASRGEPLEAVGGDGREVPGEPRVLGQHHRAPCHEAVYQRSLLWPTHFDPRRVFAERGRD